ncbi:MAG: acyl-CoA dehydrogenase [Deltaproteobacteria bacterium]|nr:acyl-CoA dehydrogenase [Deltaproteobacteria bacterium]
MALNPLVDTRDNRFVLFELLQVDRLNKYQAFAEFDRDTYASILGLAEKIAVEVFQPANAEADKTGCQYDPEKQEVRAPECLRAMIQAYNEAGFLSLSTEAEYGGMGMPHVVHTASMEYFVAGCMSSTLYATLTVGAANLIKNFGSEEQKNTYLPKMFSGEWGGTMCLTEPVAGSDVGALKTKAVRQADGTYLISGEKIFISAGENNLYSNIIHAVLGRVEGDPKGSKGISIFIVPKFLVNPDGSLGARNDWVCTGIEHKMGIKASATCSLSFGDNGKCIGYLLGEERQGMKIMFQMMNEARLDVAMQGHGLSSAAYMHAVTYARNRVQGASVKRGKSSDIGPVTIVNHPDVKRMLMWMKAHVEGTRMLMLCCALNIDLSHAAEGREAQEAQGLVDLLIPICKAGITDTAVLVTSEAVQTYGGYGYCSDYPVEQFMRDSKITAIYEGTNGIQAMDLIMRKVLMNPERFNYSVFRKRVLATVESAKGVVEEKYTDVVREGIRRIDDVIGAMDAEMKAGEIEAVYANATPFCRAMFLLTLAWLHLWSLTLSTPKVKKLVGNASSEEIDSKIVSDQEAAYYYGRMLSAQFYLGAEFSHFFGIIDYILSAERAVTRASAEIFTGALEA